MKKKKSPPCNAPGCPKPAGGFLCKYHSSMLAAGLKSATRKAFKKYLSIPSDRRTQMPVILLAAIRAIQEKEVSR